MVKKFLFGNPLTIVKPYRIGHSESNATTLRSIRWLELEIWAKKCQNLCKTRQNWVWDGQLIACSTVVLNWLIPLMIFLVFINARMVVLTVKVNTVNVEAIQRLQKTVSVGKVRCLLKSLISQTKTKWLAWPWSQLFLIIASTPNCFLSKLTSVLGNSFNKLYLRTYSRDFFWKFFRHFDSPHFRNFFKQS